MSGAELVFSGSGGSERRRGVGGDIEPPTPRKASRLMRGLLSGWWQSKDGKPGGSCCENLIVVVCLR